MQPMHTTGAASSDRRREFLTLAAIMWLTLEDLPLRAIGQTPENMGCRIWLR